MVIPEYKNGHFEEMAAWSQTLQIVSNSTMINLQFDTHTLGQSSCKVQLISKANCQPVNSSKKRTNRFYYYAMCFRSFLEEIEDTKKTFRNYLTFKRRSIEKLYMSQKACPCPFIQILSR